MEAKTWPPQKRIKKTSSEISLREKECVRQKQCCELWRFSDCVWYIEDIGSFYLDAVSCQIPICNRTNRIVDAGLSRSVSENVTEAVQLDLGLNENVCTWDTSLLSNVHQVFESDCLPPNKYFFRSSLKRLFQFPIQYWIMFRCSDFWHTFSSTKIIQKLVFLCPSLWCSEKNK